MLYIKISKNSKKSSEINRKLFDKSIAFSSIEIAVQHKINRVADIVWDDNHQIGIYVYGYYQLVSDYKAVGDWERSLKNIIASNKNTLENIPNCFANGMYVGVIIDSISHDYYVFNNHFNHLPLFYYEDNDKIAISTEYEHMISNIESVETNNYVINEYLTFGMTFTDRALLKRLRILGKCTILRYNSDTKNVTEKQYYNFPKRDEKYRSFSDYIEEFYSIWQNVNNKFSFDINEKHSLGLTGGLDSRLILCETYKYNNIYYNTGNSVNNPDYIIANRLTKAFGVGERHFLEDYENNKQDKFTEYIKYLTDFNYPMDFCIPASNRQLQWKKKHNIDIQITGNGGEYIGGEHYYTKRDSFWGVLKLSTGYLPKNKKLTKEDYYNLMFLVSRAKKSDTIFDGYSIENDVYFQNYLNNISNNLIKEPNSQAYFLEKARLLFKFTNLLQYAFLGIKNDVELISPFFDLELINFATKVPLPFRKNRKLVYNLIKSKYKLAAKEVVEGSIFNINAPHCMFSLTKPFLKGLNKKGYKVPLLQSYIKKKTYNDSLSNAKIFEFKKELLKQTNREFKIFNQDVVKEIKSKVTIERAFNINITIMKSQLSTSDYIEKVNRIAHGI